MGDKKDNNLINEQALTEEELNRVTAGFSIWDSIVSFFKGKKSDYKNGAISGIGRPDGGNEGFPGLGGN